MPSRTYSDDEVREILRRAVEQSSVEGGGLTREELIEAARDAGIEASAVHDAIGVVERDREVQGEILALRKKDRKTLASNVLSWAIIALGLLAMRFFGAGGWWFIWPMGAWAIFLLLRLKGVLLESPEKVRERAERRIEHRRRQQKRSSGHIDHRKKIEAAQNVERGLEELLGAAARRSGKAASARVRAPDAPEGEGTEDSIAAERSAAPNARGRSRS